MKTLTLDEFRATRTFVPDARVHPTCEVYHEEGEGAHLYPQPALVYDGYWAIGIVTPHWEVDSFDNNVGTYHLVISNQEWMDDDLDALERRLWTQYTES